MDLARNVIRRIPNKTARRNPKPVIVPVHPVLRDFLNEVTTDNRGEYVLPETAVLYAQRIDAVTDRIQAHFKSCGINPHKPGTGPASKEGKRAVIEVGFHSLRHTFVSLCRESNAPLAVVESIVGHSNPSMTRHYTHVGEIAAGQAVALLPSVMDKTGKRTPAQPEPDGAAILLKAHSIAKGMTAANWKAMKAALLALLETNGQGGQKPVSVAA